MISRILKPLTLADAEQAAELLGLPLSELNTETLRNAFRDRVRQIHPDTGYEHQKEMTANAAEEIQRAYGARATLLSWLAQQPKPGCKVCGGKGYVRSGPFQTRLCTSC